MVMARELKVDRAEDALQRHRGELTRLLEEYKTADAKEKAELRADIDELKEKIEADKKAREAAEKAEGTGGTLVLPPEQASQGQHHGDDRGRMEHASATDTSDGGKKRGSWKKAW
jgi:seryl-tRNA synthetase